MNGGEMSVSEATLKALKKLGLTEYEVQAYVALVDGGQMAASDISTVSKVPYSRIYDVLGRLEEKGFVQIQRGRPTRYIAKAPTEIMQLVRLAWEEKLETAGRVVVEELQPRFERETQATSRDVWLLHGRAAILAKALEMVGGAKEEVMFSLPTMDMSAISETINVEDLTEIVERILTLKVPKIHILTSHVPDNLKTMISSDVEVRTRDKVFGAGLVIDRRQTLITLAGGESEQSFLGIYSSHAVFAEIANLYFDSLWNESNPL
jgi:sugar-specific transcriptional regulator TrmB